MLVCPEAVAATGLVQRPAVGKIPELIVETQFNAKGVELVEIVYAMGA